MSIIRVILKLIDEHFLLSSFNYDQHHIHYEQLVWIAVLVVEYPNAVRSFTNTKLNSIILSFFIASDSAFLTD